MVVIKNEFAPLECSVIVRLCLGLILFLPLPSQHPTFPSSPSSATSSMHHLSLFHYQHLKLHERSLRLQTRLSLQRNLTIFLFG